MGDLVAVLQAGGRLAQFGAAGRDPRRARVGLRGPLRRRGPRAQAAVADAGSATSSSRPPPRPASASDAADARRRTLGRRRSPTCCSSTTDDRPLGWVDERQLPRGRAALDADLASPTSPLLDRRTTLKDALSMLLDADVQAGIVVDAAGARGHRDRVDADHADDAARGDELGTGRSRDGGRVIDWAWMGDHLDDARSRGTVQHLYLAADRGRDRVRDLVRAGGLVGPPAPRLRAGHGVRAGSCTRSRASRCSPRWSRSPGSRSSPRRSRSSCTRS